MGLLALAWLLLGSLLGLLLGLSGDGSFAFIQSFFLLVRRAAAL